MPYLIDGTDKPDGAALRQKTRPEHMAYLDKHAARFLAVGAKLRDDGETAWGSLYILDTDERAEAEEFIKNDPFSKAGLFGTVTVTRWRKGYFDHAKVPPKA